jgi:hypothetical protein
MIQSRSGQPGFQHAQQALGFGDIAIARTLVLVLAAGELVEEADLAEHRADRGHLEEHPGQGLVALGRILGQELAGLLRQIDQDRAGLEQAERLSARAVRIDDGGDLAVGVQRQEFRRPGLVLADVDRMRLIRQADLLQHDRHLDPVRRGQAVELQPVGMLGGPALGDREG